MQSRSAMQTGTRPAHLHLGDEPIMLPALDLGEVGVGAAVDHHLVHHLVCLLRIRLPGSTDLAQQPHAQRDVHPLQYRVWLIRTAGSVAPMPPGSMHRVQVPV